MNMDSAGKTNMMAIAVLCNGGVGIVVISGCGGGPLRASRWIESIFVSFKVFRLSVSISNVTIIVV